MTPEDAVSRTEIFQVVTDLHGLIRHGLNVVYCLFGLILLQIAVKLWESARVARIGKRVERQLDMAAQHGAVTDGNKERLERLLAEATAVLGRVSASTDKAAGTAETVTTAVQEVPHRTADEVVRRIGGDSFHTLPAPGREGA